MVTGYYVSRAIHVAAKLGIADLLADGPRGHDELAKATGTHADSLRRVLRLLAGAGVFVEEEDGKFALTPIGACLRSGVPGSMRAAALLFGGITQQAWGDLLYSVETSEPAFRRVFGKDPFDYMAEHPDEAANFDAAMADFTKHIAIAVAAAYDFSPFRRIVDVGGGNGALLAGILAANPTLTGVVFDLPDVAARATAQIRELGLADRCEIVGGDFFEEVPSGGDAYLLKHVIHDWNDDRATAILRTCRRAMGAEAKLLIVEGVYPPRIDQSDESRGAAANDVNMLVCTGGRQRSEAEFRSLYEAAGFRLTRIVPTADAGEGDRRSACLGTIRWYQPDAEPRCEPGPTAVATAGSARLEPPSAEPHASGRAAVTGRELLADVARQLDRDVRRAHPRQIEIDMEPRQWWQPVARAQDFESIRHRRGEQRHHREVGFDRGAQRLHVADLTDRSPVAAGVVQRLDHDRPERAVLGADRHR